MTDYDSPWKEVTEKLFPSLMAFFFPKIYAEIDWREPVIFLDKELQAFESGSPEGRLYVDKLVDVCLLNGKREWVLIHIEFQADYDQYFAQRVFVYYYKLYDNYQREVVSLGILGDLSKSWRPNTFELGRWGCKVTFTFPLAKLLDYDSETLDLSSNPFALVVKAHLTAKKAAGDESREHARWKKELFRLALLGDYSRQEVVALMRFIDWVLQLPNALDKQLRMELQKELGDEAMTYVTSFERFAKEEGKIEGQIEGQIKGKIEGKIEGQQNLILALLKARFGTLPAWVSEKVKAATEELLGTWGIALLKSDRLEDVFAS